MGIDEDAIRKIQKNLLQISETGRAPINLHLYETKLGLVKSVNKTITLPNGNTEMVFDKLVLTEKGRNILNVVI